MKELIETIDKAIAGVKRKSDGSEYFKGVIDGLELVKDHIKHNPPKKDKLATLKECFDGNSRHDQSNKEFVDDITQSGKKKEYDIRSLM